MAQLSDDCFAFSGPLLPVAEMERLIAERVTPVAEIEEVGLGAALGRVVAADVVAHRRASRRSRPRRLARSFPIPSRILVFTVPSGTWSSFRFPSGVNQKLSGRISP